MYLCTSVKNSIILEKMTLCVLHSIKYLLRSLLHLITLITTLKFINPPRLVMKDVCKAESARLGDLMALQSLSHVISETPN